MAKLTVITNSAGEVVGTANYTGDKGSPTLARLAPGPDRIVHEIEVADDLLRLPAHELHLKLQQTHFANVKTAK